MTRNLLVCGLGLLLAGGLGLSTIRASVPAGTSAVGDYDAAQVYGGQTPPCQLMQADANAYACGLQAKPAPMATWCTRWATPFQSGNPVQVWAKNTYVYYCYECCWPCGSGTVYCPCDQPQPSTTTP